MDENALLIEGVNAYKARDFASTERVCRQILATNPGNAHAIHLMAAVGKEVENYDMAEGLARMAIDLDPKVADFYYTLGSIRAKQGKLEDALAHLQKAVDIEPKHHRALVELGSVCKDIGAVRRDNNMLEGALSFYTRALAIKADEDIYVGIAHTHYLTGNYPQTIETGHAGLKRFPNSVKILQAISGVYNYMQYYEESLACCQKVIALEPDNYTAYANMATTLKNLGKLDEAISALKKALEGIGDEAWVHSNLLLTMIYAPSVSPEELADAARNFGESVADPLLRSRPFKNNRSPTRKLRVGYLSPDFRNHAVRYFLSPIYYADKDNFELYAYSKTDLEDYVTTKLKSHFDHWRDIKYYKDDRIADLIEEDKIDILIDLAGHTGTNGLLVFARKPAPVQVTWLGHPATSGMKAMDYRITDSFAEPPGMTEHLNVETLWRLPDIFCAYSPHENSPDVIDHPPFDDNGYITLGCFNNFTKVTDEVLESWGAIMSHVADSRILLEVTGINNKKIRDELEERLGKFLPMDRVILEPRNKLNQFVLYNKIDIALDPFPCVGGTTSMDALWMGVPFVTLAGRQFLSRMGVTILTNAGLPELIAENKEEYISKVVALAEDKDRLRAIRSGLRGRFAASPAMDETKFARNFEAALREMWKIYVAKKN